MSNLGKLCSSYLTAILPNAAREYMQGKMANFLSTFDSEAHFQPKQLQTTFQRIVNVLGNPIPDSILEFPENCRTGPPVPRPTPRFDPEATGTLSSAVASHSGSTFFSLFGPDSKQSSKHITDSPKPVPVDKGSLASVKVSPVGPQQPDCVDLEPELKIFSQTQIHFLFPRLTKQ